MCVGIVSNIEDAKKLITRKAVDSGMTYVKVVTKAVPKTIQDIEQRMRKEEQKLNDYLLKNNCYDRKSATIGCKGCGSSLSTKHMAAKKLNKCPLCGTELRTLKRSLSPSSPYLPMRVCNVSIAGVSICWKP